MTSAEAKQILLRYRPGTADAADPEVGAALNMLHSDPELARWFNEHCAFQVKMRHELRGIAAPRPDKKALRRKIVPGPAIWWRKSAPWLAAAAVLIAVAVVGRVMWKPGAPAGFENYRERMVRTVIRAYPMDVATEDMEKLRSHLAIKNAPAKFTIPQGLQGLPLTGGGVLTWRGKPASMVCFDKGGGNMVFLFVMDRANVPNPPPRQPQLAQVSKLTTASWSEGDKTYVVAAEEDAKSLEKRL